MLTVEETEVAEHHLQDLGWKVWVWIELSRWRRLDRLLARSTWDDLECWHIMSVYLTSSSYRRVLTWTAVFCTFSDIFSGGVVGNWLKVRSVGGFICRGKAESFDHISQNVHTFTTTSGPHSTLV
jgi:hypothetical protein